MTAAEKIYYAKERWDCSFEELSYLLEMDKKEVAKLYHQQKKLELPKIAIDAETTCLDLSESTKNRLKRLGIYTVKDLLTYTHDFDVVEGLGKLGVQEIHEVIQKALSVLKLTAANLMQLFASPGTVVELMWANGEPNDYHSVITKYKILTVKKEKVLSISGREKGWLKTIPIVIWF